MEQGNGDSDNIENVIELPRGQRCVQNFSKHLRCSFFTKIANDWKLLTFSGKSSIFDTSKDFAYVYVGVGTAARLNW